MVLIVLIKLILIQLIYAKIHNSLLQSKSIINVLVLFKLSQCWKNERKAMIFRIKI